MERIRVLLERLRDQLSVGGEHRFAGDVDAALASCDDAVAAFVMSNELWGGAGSIADQAREQIAMGYANPRTEMWTSAFNEWHTQNI